MLLAGVFFGPFIIATVLYFGGYERNAQVNYGRFVSPEIALPAQLHFNTELRSRWTLFVLSEGVCDGQCNEALTTITQVRLATGREIDRIARALVVRKGAATAAADDDALYRFDANAELGKSVITALAALPTDKIYIMDPVGNLVLSYPLNADRKRLHGDLKKLLKLSRIG